MEPEKPRLNPSPGRPQAHPEPASRRGSGPYTEPPRKPTETPARRPWLATLAVAAVVGLGALGAYHYLGTTAQAPPAAAASQSRQTLTLSGADVDQAATAEAIAAIRSGSADPLIANLTAREKQQIVSGERKFYKLPMLPPAGSDHAASAPATSPTGTGTANTKSAAPAHAASAPHASPAHSRVHYQSRHLSSPHANSAALAALASDAERHATREGRLQIALNGVVYATPDATDRPYTLDVPLKLGDITTITCIELAPGRSSVTVGIGTMLNPVQVTLTQGQTQTFVVAHSGQAQDYSWFQSQAQRGNPVAEYGLGHMYQYGIGVPRDTSQAVYWYRQAANQNYLDARQRLAELGR